MSLFLWCVVAGIVVVVVAFALFSNKLTALLPSGKAKTILLKADVLADKATAATALQVLVMLFSERGQTDTVKMLGDLWVKIWAWQPPPVETVIDMPTATVETLSARIESLKTELAAARRPKV